MSSPPGASVVIPVRDAEETIADCLDSVLRLNYRRDAFEVVVVDNGSSDRTPGILEHYASHVRIVREPRPGRSRARNAGVRHARHELVALTDADCTVAPDWLTKIVLPLRDETVGLAGGTILSRRPCNYVESYGELIHDHERAITKQNPPYVIGMNCAARRSTLEMLGGFDHAFPRGEDVDLSYRMLRAGYRFGFQPDAVVYHRNESTLLGLFREGFLHGFWSVPTLRRHSRLVPGRSPVRAYRELWGHVSKAVREPGDLEARCHAAFGAGKKLGKAAGSARFRYLEL